MQKSKDEKEKIYPPVVSVLGHVDHGKTSLLDAIRKTNVVAREIGGITQKIGASDIEVIHEGIKRRITFIDTPGHESFSKMRSRGAQVADIGLLIVSAVDGVMPQTRESISLLLNAKIPFIVVLTKVDLPEKNTEKVKQQLMKEGIQLEGYGGDVPVIEVSAKTGQNVKELLELITLLWDMRRGIGEKMPSEKDEFKGIVIESKLDPKIGSKATVVVKNGILSIKDEITTDTGEKGKVRALINDRGERLNSVTVGDAVEILGFEKVPSVGSIVVKQGVQIKIIEEERERKRAQYQIEEGRLPIVLVADTLGSLEAIIAALPKNVDVALKKTGEVTTADILLAKSIGAIVLSFNLKLSNEVIRFAKTERVLLKNYTIIYELLDELKEVAEGKIQALEEEILGTAKVLASFPFEKTKVLGIKVLDGRVARGDKARIIRGENIIGESTISSIRQGKNQVSKIEKNQEGGIILSPFLDFTIGDMLLCLR